MTEIQKLSADIAAASNAYYNGASHGLVINDAKFDAMVDRLRELDPENKFFSTVGAAPIDSKKVTHVTRMLSLDKCTTPAEVNKFSAQMVPTTTYTVQPKLDGSAIELVYEDGKLTSASTRGNGTVGNDILANVQDIPTIPKVLADVMNPRVVVRGECMMSFNDFAKVGGTNPRNVGNGILVRSESVNRELLTFSAYGVDIYSYDGALLDMSYSDSMDVLKSLGFLHPQTELATATTLQETIERMGQMRGDSAFPTDGLVVQVNDPSLRKEMGVGQKYPNYAFAYKFQSEFPSAVTKLLSITLQVGHSGAIAPVAELEPVECGGVAVSRVYLNNFEFIKDADIAVGDHVKVVRRGEIIPYIEGVVEKALTCPHCGFVGTLQEQVAQHAMPLGMADQQKSAAHRSTPGTSGSKFAT